MKVISLSYSINSKILSAVQRLSLLSACCLLSACGGSGGGTPVQVAGGTGSVPGLAVYGAGDNDPSTIFTPWLVSINNYRSASSASGSEAVYVSTLRYSEQRTLQMHLDFYRDQWVLDTCTVPNTSPDTGGGSGGTPPYVSAGSSVVINTPSGPWYTLQQQVDSLRYFAGNQIPGPLPAGATLSIPASAEFPSVAAYPLYQPGAPVRISPQQESIVDIDTEYSWVSDNDPATTIDLYFYNVDANGQFLEWNELECHVADDGSFAMPQIALDYIDLSQSNIKVKYERQLRRVDYIDGIAFYQRSNVGE